MFFFSLMTLYSFNFLFIYLFVLYVKDKIIIIPVSHCKLNVLTKNLYIQSQANQYFLTVFSYFSHPPFITLSLSHTLSDVLKSVCLIIFLFYIHNSPTLDTSSVGLLICLLNSCSLVDTTWPVFNI